MEHKRKPFDRLVSIEKSIKNLIEEKEKILELIEDISKRETVEMKGYNEIYKGILLEDYEVDFFEEKSINLSYYIPSKKFMKYVWMDIADYSYVFE